MRKFRKFAGLMLALVMALAMSVTALADTTQYTITINNSTKDYEYTAYQIFVGDLSGGTLSNIEFGSALSADDQAKVLAYYSTTLGILDGTTYEVSAAGLAKALAANAITAADFASYIADYNLSSADTSTYNTNTSNYTITVTGAGYYLIENTDVPDENGAYTSYILEVVKDVNVDPKADIPSSDKKVADINDSTETTAIVSTTDSADYDIGDHVPFTLTATMPTHYGDYTTYQLIFHDTLSSGLSFDEDSVTVTVTTSGTTTTVSSGYTLVTDATVLTDNCSFEVQITDTNALTDDTGSAISVTANSVITVSYTAELLSSASYMETNEMFIEYSNNPNASGTGKTTKDKTTVFTFTLTVDKTDSGSNPLSGAGFTLYKYDADIQDYVAVGSEISGGTSFNWSGLDDGQYKLVETTTPSGYNTMEDLVFYIVAEHNEDEITSLKVTSDAAGTTEITGYEENLSNGTITANIVNYKGSELPSTGGIGTTIFYVIGTILVLLAAVLLITRSRMRKNGEQ
ncbi:MAG: isopeptide-forming domain-containing fimbrial protein [Lachnospiraceae bacterium]|nr:isopeptide-forming domain-containing fimbrial protein [Lachnospiraceae bacterium]